MGAGTGSFIEAADYIAIRTKIRGIMGAGSGQSGYGQLVLSDAFSVSSGVTITKEQWDALRYDIINARLHQDGLVPAVVEAVRGQPIRFGAGFPNNQYNSQADTIIEKKWELGVGQFVIDEGTDVTRTTSWSSQISTTCTVTFNTADEARWFFNSGGKIRIAGSRIGGSSTPQNSAWSTLLSTAGVQSFGGNTSGLNFYQLTTSYQTFYLRSASTPYSSNQYKIEVLCNQADNSVGGANQITLKVSFIDLYAYSGSGSPLIPDNVDGDLTVVIDEIRASGTLQPLGTGPFQLNRPIYSITALTGS